MIRSEDLSFEYKDGAGERGAVPALDGISMDIADGQFVSIVGANGSGKSTFARHLNALLVPTGGTLWVGGLDTSLEENVLPVRRHTGMVFQNPDNQIVASTVDEDVAFGLENIGVPTEEIWQRVEKSLAAVGMSRYRDASPVRLSGGQKQRVAIAGVLAMKPKCIVLDEATSMLDPEGRKEIISAVRELNEKEGVSIILITHFMEETISSDRIFVMDKGKVAMEGTPEYIFSDISALEKYGLEAPCAAYIADRLRREGIDIGGTALSVDDLLSTFADYGRAGGGLCQS